MNRVTASVLFLFALLAWLGGRIVFEDKPDARSNEPASQVQLPNYQAFAMHSTLYAEDGSISHEVYAQKMAHYDKPSFTLFQQPRYVVYIEGKKNPWQISALEGKLTENQLLILNQGVIIQSTDHQGLIQTLQTSHLQLDLNSKDVISDQPVTITGDNYIIESKGIKANLRDNTFKIGEHVKSTFNPVTQG